MLKPEPRTELLQRLENAERHLAVAVRRLDRMEASGGFADTKTLSKRCMRIEQRLEKLERSAAPHGILIEALHSVVRSIVSGLVDHLYTRHQEALVTGKGIDVDAVRMARRRLDTMGQELAALQKQAGS